MRRASRRQPSYCAWGCFRYFVVRPGKPRADLISSRAGGRIRVSAIDLQRGDEGFLRNVDLAELPHLLLAFLLLLQKFAFTRDVAAVAFRGDVLAQRAYSL